ncbi:hypothetical protein NG798_07070 [Ancylothrix sp. C2]|uniref:hypothetical protein n=1 Tax=Ancylothrix sp. D3o TaxID=2953691 RepID=UPI0021BAD3F0|nr:hypothetical protein [Ancylothrix sp. D3o]MCT7949542.1 hypothetical protein [Ancylothrix sp. D3o]
MFQQSLRNILLGATLAAPMLALNAPHAQAQDIRDFSVNNATGRVLTELYVSPADRDTWGPDILGVDVLPPRESVEVRFSPRTSAEGCIYDIRAQWDDGKISDLYDYNLCTLNAVNFTATPIQALW